MFGMIFCFTVLSNLYHARPMAFDVTSVDKPDDLLIGKPTVGQYIAEPYTTVDGPLYHIFCE